MPYQLCSKREIVRSEEIENAFQLIHVFFSVISLSSKKIMESVEIFFEYF
jgi:hypothetical protein